MVKIEFLTSFICCVFKLMLLVKFDLLNLDSPGKDRKFSDLPHINSLTFTFMHLADAFIQSDLEYIQAIHFFVSMCVPWELNPQPSKSFSHCRVFFSNFL